ncbi:hypothetical protein [Flavobacterium piscisymbiosum]|uniref:Class I SAM-dependent methyltransferase n=1 Tax=Flavobacterium piscisymbiosum TaxID=2893753 RepID=A0ABS8M880_9FLAO|nr:hypothetical protein [Flavobacterium sp. F-30]MCC9061716.1 hypothetical protein [Flavobacterium sp. F-30]
MKKILFKILNKFKNRKDQNRVRGIQKATNLLKSKKESDSARWAKNNELFSNWNERTAILASFIKPDSSIIEFGAGVMHMKTLLKDFKLYTPTDIVKRYDETVVCDLNEPISLNLQSYNVAVFSGVLEYVYDVDNIIRQLSHNNIEQIILSYCCSDIVKLSRDKNGWLSDLTKKELETVFSNYNYKIEAYKEWNNQSIYNLIKG